MDRYIFSKIREQNIVSIRFCWFLVFVLVSFAGNSQNIPGSVYSVFSVGDVQERSSAYTRALGGTSIAVRNDGNINAANPASLTAMAVPVTSFFELGTYYGRTSFTSASTSATTRFGGLQGINYWFKLKKRWAALLGVSPYSATSYSVLTTNNVQSQGSGGINQFYFSNAFDITKNLSLGVTTTYYLGSIKKEDLVPAQVEAAAFDVENNITANGGNYDFGLQYKFNVKKSKFIFGATWDRGAHLSGTQQIAIVNPLSFDTLNKSNKVILKTRLPTIYGAGVCAMHGRSTIAFDLRYNDWRKVTFDEQLPYRNGFKYSVGYELRGDYTSFNYLKTISLRAGAWLQDYPVIVRNTKLSTWGYTFGIALPIQNNRATVALNYSITTLGIAKLDLIKEQANRLSLDLIFRDVWGIKRKFE